MSYSRWSNSSWYTFWAVRGEKLTPSDINEEVFAGWYNIDKCIDWSYKEVDALLHRAPDAIIKHLAMLYGCSLDEANELQEYMQEWRTDVRRQYNT